MIRINLLGIKREAKKGGAPAVSLEGAKLAGMAALFLVAGVGAAMVHYTIITKEADQISKDMSEAEKEKARLAAVRAQYDQQVTYKADLSRRIDIIENLKRQQTGPAEMLSALSGTVANAKTVWLTTFENAGDRITMEGLATSVDAVAQFIHNLKNSGQFKNVEIRETFQNPGSAEIETFVFRLSAEVARPGSPEAAKPRA